MNKKNISHVIKSGIFIAVLSILFIQHSQSGGYIEPEYLQHTLTEDVAFFCPNETTLKKGETVSIIAKVADDDYLWVETASGMRGSIRGHYNYPRPEYEYNWEDGAYVMPMDKFYDEVIEKSFDEVDRMYRKIPYIHERPVKGNTVNLEMQFLLYDLKTWNLYHPRVTFIDGTVHDIEYVKEKNRNKLLLRFCPFARKIFGNSFINRLASKSQLTEISSFHDNKFMNVLSDILKFLQTLVYMALTGWIPIMIISILLYWPASLKFISNPVMYILMMSIGIVGSYLWLVICLLEGYPWWMMAVLFALCCTWTSLFAVKETDKRCPKCKIMGWLDKIKIKAHKSYNEKTRAWETTYIGTFTNNIDGTIITRTYWPDDDAVLSESSREGVIGQTKTSVFRHDLVEKEYKVRNTTHIYQCKKCGHTFDKTEQDRHLISRTVLDSNTSRNSSTTYFYERDPKKS